MKSMHLLYFAVASLLIVGPASAQRSHPGGGPPPGRGPGSDSPSSMGQPSHSSDMGQPSHAANMAPGSMSHAAPADVLSKNKVISDKIKSLTGQDAAAACDGFKNLGQCVAAAHVANNLNIHGGFSAVKAKMTGSDSMSLGKAIEQLAPSANSKAESKKAKKQASGDMKEASAT